MMVGSSCTDGANKIHNESSFEHFQNHFRNFEKYFFFPTRTRAQMPLHLFFLYSFILGEAMGW